MSATSDVNFVCVLSNQLPDKISERSPIRKCVNFAAKLQKLYGECASEQVPGESCCIILFSLTCVLLHTCSLLFWMHSNARIDINTSSWSLVNKTFTA